MLNYSTSLAFQHHSVPYFRHSLLKLVVSGLESLNSRRNHCASLNNNLIKITGSNQSCNESKSLILFNTILAEQIFTKCQYCNQYNISAERYICCGNVSKLITIRIRLKINLTKINYISLEYLELNESGRTLRRYVGLFLTLYQT